MGLALEDEMTPQLDTPVLFLIFNRPEVTGRVFEAIRAIAPKQLFVAADGPRLESPADGELCAGSRAVLARIDWPCEVKTLSREKNFGCKLAVSSAITWFFEQVEEGIILEDDCLPHASFFSYCADLLERYRDDERIMHIGGANFQFGGKCGSASYYFSRYSHVWGWASWRRAWRHYDVEMKGWSERVAKRALLLQFPHRKERRFWELTWDAVCAGKIETWDFQWAYWCLVQNGLAAVPNVNLVSNIGFGGDSTHTHTINRLAQMPVEEMSFPLIHPTAFGRDVEGDEATGRLFFQHPRLMRRILARVRRIVTGPLI